MLMCISIARCSYLFWKLLKTNLDILSNSLQEDRVRDDREADT